MSIRTRAGIALAIVLIGCANNRSQEKARTPLQTDATLAYGMSGSLAGQSINAQDEKDNGYALEICADKLKRRSLCGIGTIG